MSTPTDALLALACLDLTTLNDDDTEAEVAALAERALALAPIAQAAYAAHAAETEGATPAAGASAHPSTGAASATHATHAATRNTSRPTGLPAALCVWPRLAAFARTQVPTSVAIAAVANFPHGGTDVQAAVRDAATIADAGAQEVDVVLPWRALAAGDTTSAAAVLRGVRRASQGLTLKVILETGELRGDAWIRQASALALAEGADFLKTSTGKVPVGATPEAARATLETIAGTPGCQAGFKASGGVRTVQDAARFAALVSDILGDAALTPQRFRLGASGLLQDIAGVLGGRTATQGMASY